MSGGCSRGGPVSSLQEPELVQHHATVSDKKFQRGEWQT